MPKNQLRWACRRGMRELDLILISFLENDYGELSSGDQQSFEKLLFSHDPELMDWLISGSSPPPAFEFIIKLIRSAINKNIKI